MKKYFWYSLVPAIIFITDRLTKMWALVTLTRPREINSYLSFELLYNRGVSWGMFGSDNTVTFVAVSSMIACITLYLAWHAYIRARTGNTIVGELMVLAGSCSNLLDRVLYGGVVDFIALSYGDWSWPVFNVADMAVVCGVAVMCITHILQDDE